MGSVRRSPLFLPAILALCLLWLPGCDPAGSAPVEALGPSFAKVDPGGTTLDLRSKAKLLEDGTVRVRVEAGCPEGLTVLEAFVIVSQEHTFGEAFFPAECTGRTRKHTLIVTALEGSFPPHV